MLLRLRPRLGRSPSLLAAIAALALFVSANVACSASSRDGTLLVGNGAQIPGAPSAGGDRPVSCAPEVGGLVPSEIPSLEVDCPRGYATRKSLAALPVVGRFATLKELTDAFCISSSSSGPQPVPTLDPRAPTFAPSIDFASNDVVAYAFDELAGEPALFARGDDLWLQVRTDTCDGQAPRLNTIAFAVPKNKKVNEQSCARACE